MLVWCFNSGHFDRAGTGTERASNRMISIKNGIGACSTNNAQIRTNST